MLKFTESRKVPRTSSADGEGYYETENQAKQDTSPFAKGVSVGGFD